MDALALSLRQPPPGQHAGVPVAARELLCTARLVLREFAPGDEPTLQRMHQNERLRAQLIDDAPLHLADTAALFVRRMGELYRAQPGLGIWHARLLHDGADASGGFAGWFSLMPLTGHPGEVELGSRLLPAHWGSGLALEGGQALLHHAFTRLGLPRVWGLCDPANRGARLALAALGFGPGEMAPCPGGQALYHQIDATRFRRALARPRRERLQDAATQLRAVATRAPSPTA
jgi:RimJ/RimL family protein N-acetyltransferase